MAVRIRPLASADLASMPALLARAYGSDDENDLARRLSYSLGAGDVATFVAELDGAPAGMVLGNDYGTSAYVALMAVDPSRQRRGIGRAIMDALVAWLDARGMPAELHATPAGEQLYLQYGFRVEGAAEIWNGRGRGAITAEGVRPYEPADFDAVLAFDRAAFGSERRGALARAVGEPANRAFVLPSRGGGIAGFSIGQGALRVLGPVTALDAGGAQRLFDAASAALDGPHRVNVDQRPEAIALVKRGGYELARTASRMVRGTLPPSSLDRIFVRLNLGQG